MANQEKRGASGGATPHHLHRGVSESADTYRFHPHVRRYSALHSFGSILRLAPPSESGCASDGFRANSAWPSPSRVYLLSLSPLAGGGLQSPVQSQPEAVQRLCRSRPRHTTQALRLQGPHRVQSRHAGSHPLPPPPKGACAAAPPTPLPSPSISPSVRSRQGPA